MDKPLDEIYLKWLYRQVASIRLKNPARTYWSLLRQLYTKEFVGLVPNDDNRVEDGRDLRYEFIKDSNVEPDQEWLGLGCSMLEMLIGLARRLAFETDGIGADEWFWIMLDNVNLRRFNDGYFYDHKDEDISGNIDSVLDCIIHRTYHRNGDGGLFPLENARRDQRRVELWYQMSQYLLER